MEASVPNLYEINMDIVKPKITKTLNLKSDKSNQFEVQFYIYEDNLYFEAHSKNLCPQKDYQKFYSYQDIQKIKFFAMCEDIKDVYEEILNQINNKEDQINLVEKSNYINLNIPLNTKKIKECTFEIDEISKDVNTKINDLYSYINLLKNDVKDLKEKNKILEEKNKNLEEKNKNLEERVEEFDKILLLYKEEIKQKKIKEEDLKKIKEWIAPGKKVTLNLVFKKTINGHTFKDFHKFCDNKGKTITFIETVEGRKFGGFSDKDWKGNDGWRVSINDFVFSLDLNKKYCFQGTGGSSSYVGDNDGPNFGSNICPEIHMDIYFKYNLNDGISNNGFYFKTNNELNNGKEEFATKELEVYQVIIN